MTWKINEKPWKINEKPIEANPEANDHAIIQKGGSFDGIYKRVALQKITQLGYGEIEFQNVSSVQVTHNLEHYVHITAIDTSGNEFECHKLHISKNEFILTWNGNESGIIFYS